MNKYRLKKCFLVATYRTFGSPKNHHAGESMLGCRTGVIFLRILEERK